MKITCNIIITILLFSFSTAVNKSITELSTVEIDDLFYNPELQLSPSEIAKAKLNQVDEILVDNEDLELESLEIADIDLVTFGEYEDFLNKYYDDNYVTINSRFIRQLELNLTTISGLSFPFSKNLSNRFSSGSSFGLIYNSSLWFNIYKFPSNITLEASLSSLPTQTEYFSDLKLMKVNIGLASKMINRQENNNKSKHNLTSQISLGLVKASSKHMTWYVDNTLTAIGMTGNFDLTYVYNLKYFGVGLKLRAQSILVGTLSPPSIGNGSNELFEVNLVLSKPIYLEY